MRKFKLVDATSIVCGVLLLLAFFVMVQYGLHKICDTTSLSYLEIAQMDGIRKNPGVILTEWYRDNNAPDEPYGAWLRNIQTSTIVKDGETFYASFAFDRQAAMDWISEDPDRHCVIISATFDASKGDECWLDATTLAALDNVEYENPMDFDVQLYSTLDWRALSAISTETIIIPFSRSSTAFNPLASIVTELMLKHGFDAGMAFLTVSSGIMTLVAATLMLFYYVMLRVGKARLDDEDIADHESNLRSCRLFHGQLIAAQLSCAAFIVAMLVPYVLIDKSSRFVTILGISLIFILSPVCIYRSWRSMDNLSEHDEFF